MPLFKLLIKIYGCGAIILSLLSGYLIYTHAGKWPIIITSLAALMMFIWWYFMMCGVNWWTNRKD